MRVWILHFGATKGAIKSEMKSPDIHGACFRSHVVYPNRIRFASSAFYFYNCKGCSPKKMPFFSTGLKSLSHFAKCGGLKKFTQSPKRVSL